MLPVREYSLERTIERGTEMPVKTQDVAVGAIPPATVPAGTEGNSATSTQRSHGPPLGHAVESDVIK